MPSKKSTKVVLASLDPGPLESLAFFSVHGHELGAVLAAEQVGGRVANPTFRADFVRVEPQGRSGSANGAVEPAGHQFVCIFGAITRIERITATAGGANHPLARRPGRVPVHQLGPVTDTVAILSRILRETHRAARRRCGLEIFTRVRGTAEGAFFPPLRTPFGRRLPRRASPSPPKPSRRNQRDGKHHQSSDGPGHLAIVQDRHSSGPQNVSGDAKARDAWRPGLVQCCDIG